MAEKILIGENINSPLYTFTNATIKSCSCVLTSAMLVDELAVDQFMPVVYSAAYVRVALAPKNTSGLITSDGKLVMVYPGTGFLDQLPYGTPVWYYSNNALVGKFYTSRIVRSGSAFFDILAVSAVGLLDGQQHLGGIYTGETFATVAGDILGGVPFSVSSDVAGIRVYGWLPIASRRENLHQLLFACGVNLKKDAEGKIFFEFPNADTVKKVPDSRIFLGGEIDYMSPATRVEITEHTFAPLSTDETVVLFDNTQGGVLAEHDYVVFQNAPVHNLTATGSLVIHESGVNYAIVSGHGILSGQVYTHITRILSRETGVTSENHTVSVTDATLISVVNSENVARRLASYYSSVRTIQSEFVLQGERPGDQIQFNNPYHELERAFLASMDWDASSFVRAACQLVTGYLPSGGGNNYSKTIHLSGSGVWTVPSDIPVGQNGMGQIRVTLIQGGSGGSGGKMGTAGEDAKLSYDRGDPVPIFVQTSQNPGIGGLPGTPGGAGKTFVFTLEVSPGQTFSYFCGLGGLGGEGETPESEAKSGTEGGETTFDSYSSASGSVVEGGYLDIISNLIYAVPGEEGTSGDAGYVGAMTADGKGGGELGGLPSSGRWVDWYNRRENYTAWQSGGGAQGGGAYGVPGLPGETQADTSAEDVANGVTSSHIMQGSFGGNGATPLTPFPPTSIGSGGHAGHGGGGGGTGGSLLCDAVPYLISGTFSVPGGKGGLGGYGSDGAPGGIIINL